MHVARLGRIAPLARPRQAPARRLPALCAPVHRKCVRAQASQPHGPMESSPEKHGAAAHHKRAAPQETVPPHVEAAAQASADAPQPPEEAPTDSITLVYDSEWVEPVVHVRVSDERCARCVRAIQRAPVKVSTR